MEIPAINAQGATDKAAYNDGLQLLSLLYDSIHFGSCRERFLSSLAGRLNADIEHILIYDLSKGSVAEYTGSSDAPHASDSAEGLPELDFGTAVGYRVPDAELQFCAAQSSRIGVVWASASWSAQLLMRPLEPATPSDIARQHGPLLAYLLPHLGNLRLLLAKQQALLPRANAMRRVHAMLPLPLLIRRLSDNSTVLNRQGLALVNSTLPLPERSVRKSWPVSTSAWKFNVGRRILELSSSTGDARLRVFRLHQLPVGSKLHYEVFLLAGLPRATAAVNQRLLLDSFGLTAGEIELCACILEGKNPQEMAAALNLSINTVKARLKSMYRRLQVGSAAQLLVRLYFHPAFWTANYAVNAVTDEVTVA